jgi:hypothetical protein
MPLVDGLNFTEHGWERAQERGISTDEIRWAMNGVRRGIEEGKIVLSAMVYRCRRLPLGDLCDPVRLRADHNHVGARRLNQRKGTTNGEF